MTIPLQSGSDVTGTFSPGVAPHTGKLRLITSLSILLLAGASGCMTLEHVLDPDTKLEMYGGTKSSLNYQADEGSSFFGTLFRLIDLPATVVMDTLLLPISMPVELSQD